jgi:LysR family hydrogen peroxide-inducible transcriptional activator
MVDLYEGITVLPELATYDMTARQEQHIRHFKPPAPVREVSLVMHRTFVKRRLLDALKQQILLAVPEKIKKNKKHTIIPITSL